MSRRKQSRQKDPDKQTGKFGGCFAPVWAAPRWRGDLHTLPSFSWISKVWVRCSPPQAERGAASGTAPFSFTAVQAATATQSLLGFYVPGTVPSDLHTLII